MTAPSSSLGVVGARMLALAEELFPICRSITGDGVRATLDLVGRRIPLDISEVPSGTPVLDWTVPDEWNIRDAYIAKDGDRIVDFRRSNLHVVNYSEPVRAHMSLEDLRPHLHTHDTNPDWIPYRTAYYDRTWGFCLPGRVLETLDDGPYEVVVDSTLASGYLTYAECVVPGRSTSEVLISTHICHPSLANDNVSGIVVLTELAAALAASQRRLTYRLLFIPGTIGSISWLAANDDVVRRVVGGFVLACVGDPGSLSYKRSRRGDASVDNAAVHVLGRAGGSVKDFVPWGWDERQFNSPGFDLPIGCLTRSTEGEFAEYHSSADDLGLLDAARLEDALDAALGILDIMESDRRYFNLQPRGEPQLGRRGLYRGMGGADPRVDQLAMLWVLNQSDGTRSMLEIATRSGLAFSDLDRVARALVAAELLESRAWITP
jgi:aminopeptidase-like protein